MPKPKARWEYSRYRATLKRDGKFFALVTPDGNNALTEEDKETLLEALNAQTELNEVRAELSRLTGSEVTCRNWRTLLSRLLNHDPRRHAKA